MAPEIPKGAGTYLLSRAMERLPDLSLAARARPKSDNSARPSTPGDPKKQKILPLEKGEIMANFL